MTATTIQEINVTTYDMKLGDADVVIHAPLLGEEWDSDEMFAALDADPRRVIGLDVETTAHNDKVEKLVGPMHRDFHVRTVQLGTEEQAWVLRLDDPYQAAMAEAVLGDTSLRFCSHTRYDVLAVWRQFGLDITDRWIDTRLLARIANPNVFYAWMPDSADLKTLTTERFGPELEAMDKALDSKFRAMWVATGGRKNTAKQVIVEHGFTNIDLADETFVVYAGLDAIACRKLYPVLVREAQTSASLLGMECWLGGAAARLQMRGMTVDRDRLARISTEATEACGVPEAELVELVGLTPRQGQKLISWFQGEGGVDFKAYGHPTTDKGNPKLDEDAVELMRTYDLDGTAAKVVELLLAYKAHENKMGKAKELGTHISHSFDGRLHPVIDPLGTITARMSSNTPNMQNFAKKDPTMRACLLPDPGYVLVGADFDQIELRVAAALSGEQSLIDTILGGGDLHQLTADMVNCDRQTAKIVNFLLLYGGTAKALHKQLPDMPMEECYRIVDTYWEQYQAIASYRDELTYMGMEVRTRTNRRLPASESSWNEGEYDTRKFLNYLIQSSSRDIFVLAWHRLIASGFADSVWVPIHDEMILMVREDQVDEAKAALESAMTMDFHGVPITATAAELRDVDGVSRWMTIDNAEKYAKERVALAA